MPPYKCSYKSQEITVFVEQVKQWRVRRVVVTGSQLPWPTDKFPQKAFQTESEAAEYGKTAAQWVIDHPPAQSGHAKRCDLDESKC